MSSGKRSAGQSQPGLAARVDELREALQPVPVEALAERTGTEFQAAGAGRGGFGLSLFDSKVVVLHPDFVVVDEKDVPLPLPFQAVLAYYFYTSDGAPLTGTWVSFADLPDGRIYNAAFQGYTGNELVKAFGNDLASFEKACQECGGVSTPLGDAAYVFHALPRFPMLLNFWAGDEDFPSSCKVLFDSSASHHLPTDVCAILGSMLTRRVLKAA